MSQTPPNTAAVNAAIAEIQRDPNVLAIIDPKRPRGRVTPEDEVRIYLQQHRPELFHVLDDADQYYDPRAGVTRQKEHFSWKDLYPLLFLAGGAAINAAFPGATSTAIGTAGAPALGTTATDVIAGAGLPAAGTAAATGAVSTGIKKGLLDNVLSPKGLVGLGLTAAQLAALKSGPSSDTSTGPFSTTGLNDQIANSFKMQQQRMEGSQPAFDAVQRMAVGMLPTQYQPTSTSGPFGPSGSTTTPPPNTQLTDEQWRTLQRGRG